MTAPARAWMRRRRLLVAASCLLLPLLAQAQPSDRPRGAIDAERGVDARELSRSAGVWRHILLLAAATFASEDLTCITAGLLVRRGEVGALTAVAGCFLGIYAGDLGLWLLGRVLGRRVLGWRWVARRLSPARVAQFSGWFERRGMRLVIASRFMPGTRVPVYLAAGVAGVGAFRFMCWSLLAVGIWTPAMVLLVALVGRRVVLPLERLLGSSWVALAAGGLLLLAILRVCELAATETGRARLIAGVSRIWRWEFWPAWIFYLPLLPWIAWLAIRHRSITVPTAANPGIPHGGVVGESKFEILSRLPSEWIVPTALLAPGAPEARRAALLEAIARNGWDWPLILKPDAGQRGVGLKLVANVDAAIEYLARHPAATLVQTYHPGPREVGIFYYRLPKSPANTSAARGRVFSVTDKQFPVLVGDGRSTVRSLICRHPRFRMQTAAFFARMNGTLDMVLADGERRSLGIAGNHCQGTLFRDGGHLVTPALETVIDRIARSFEGFYFGRFDVRFADDDELRAGRGFRIVELNGVTSESTNIYDPTWPLWRAYGVLFRQWGLAFEIGARNRSAGVRVTPAGELWREARRYYRERRVDLLAD